MKKGDKVICVKSSTNLIVNTLYTFEGYITTYGVVVYEKPQLVYPKNCFKLALKSNKLNRKLYPNSPLFQDYIMVEKK